MKKEVLLELELFIQWVPFCVHVEVLYLHSFERLVKVSGGYSATASKDSTQTLQAVLREQLTINKSMRSRISHGYYCLWPEISF